jgi:hypothetical protein
MLEAEILVCNDCGNVHMEGGAGAHDVDECAVCDGPVDDVDVGDMIGF